MGTDRRAYDLEWKLQPGHVGMEAPLNDALLSTGRRNIPYDTGGRTAMPAGDYMGRVIEFIPYLNCYRVIIENGSVLLCAALSHKSNLPWGPSTVDVYGSGQDVLVTIRSALSYGIIVGAVPQPVTDPRDWRPDAIFGGSNVGYYLDPTSNYWTGHQGNDLIDFSAGRPYDSTSSPELSCQGVTGVGVFCDDYMAAIKADEETGLFVFYDDSLTRLTGRNLQVRAHGLEEEHLNDEGELSGYRGRSPYPWEAMGAYKPGVTTSSHLLDVAAESTVEPAPEEDTDLNPSIEPEEDTDLNPSIEPEEDTDLNPSIELEGIRNGFVQPITYDQQPFHRVTEHEGYLGQGGRESVLLPGGDVEGNEDSVVNSYHVDTKWQTVLNEQTTLDGEKVITATGGFMVVKRPPQPTPKRRERPESPLGDRGAPVGNLSKNYSPCGLLGEDETASPHIVTAEVPFAEEEALPVEGTPEALVRMTVPDEVLRTALIADEIAYSVAWEGIHTFHYHSQDYYLPVESDLGEYNRSPVPSYASLGKFQFLGEDPATEWPGSISVKVDHRYGDVSIYTTTAFFGLRSNGAFVMRTGCGCEIKSENGSLELSAPADIRLRPGRNLVGLAGHDTILKARGSIDITTSENDVRVVAAKNLMMASAVSEEGVMLLQSFSPCVLDPEKLNTIPEETEDPGEPTLPPEGPTDDPTSDPEAPVVDPETPEKKGPTYFLGEEVVGSGIVLKATKAQITTSSQLANIEVGRKEYEDEGEEEEDDPTPVDQDTGEFEPRKWTWKPGKIRLSAEFGQIECLGTYIIDYVSEPGTFTDEGFEDAGENQSGGIIQVFVNRKNMATDEENNPVNSVDLPPNVLAAAGVADLAANNSCTENESRVCYTVLAVNEFRSDRATICPQLLVNKELFVGGCAYIRGVLSVFDTIDSNMEVKSHDGRLATMKPDAIAVFDEADTRCLQLLPPVMAEQLGRFTATVSGSWLDFSCRTEEQYGTKDAFCLIETWWQHQVRVEAEAAAEQNPDVENPPPAPGTPEQDFNFFPALPEGIVYWTELYLLSDYANKTKTAPYPGLAYVYYEEPDEEEDAPTEDPGDSPTENPDDPPIEDEPRLAKRCYGVYDLSLVDEIEGRPKDRHEISPDDPEGLLNIYEDAKLNRGALREFNHYLAIDVIKPDPTEEPA